MPKGVYTRTISPWNKGKVGVQVAWNKGIPFKETSKEKMRQAKLENPVRYWLGKKRDNLHSMEFKTRHSEFMKGNKYSVGRKGPLSGTWISDRSLLVKSEKKHLDSRYKSWMLAVKNRDGWICKISNSTCSGRLEAHHILRWADFPELRFVINNGITLCAFHHPKKKEEEKRLSPYFTMLVTDKAQ